MSAQSITIEHKHKLPERVIIMTITTSRCDHIQEKYVEIKTGLVFIKKCYFWIKRSTTIVAVWEKLGQTENDSCSPEKIRNILVGELIVSPHKENPGLLLLEYREYLQKLYSLNI